MKKLWAISAALFLLALSSNTGRAVERETPKLAFELSALREAWLYGDDATAAARLDTLRRDNRLSGEFPRWYASLRSVLALKEGDTKAAIEVIQPTLDASNDARNYVRAARLFLAYAHPELALEVIHAGLTRAPDSPALQRYKAGLQWLQNDFDGALDTYVNMICCDERPQYPFITPQAGRWSGVKPWNAEGDKPPQDNDAFDDEGYGYFEEVETSGEYQPEPFTSLFLPLNWYPCDLPGLDRCVAAIAANPKLAESRTADLDALLKKAKDSQDKLDSLRTGDEELRLQLAKQATTDRWRAVIALRIAATSELAEGDWEAAEATIKSGLELAPDDIALLDLLAQVYGHLGKAEEARNGVLARLRTLAYLGIYSNTLYLPTKNQVVDRVFTPALNLYRANPQAGLTQFEQMRTSFGDTNRNQPVFSGTLGIWLSMQNEPELARKNLIEASRLNGYESGKPLYSESVLVEMALLSLGEGDTSEEEKNVQPAPADGEEDPVEMAKLDANANPLLRKSLRVGAVVGSVYDVRDRTKELTGVDVYANSSGILGVRFGARFLPNGENLMQETLWNTAEKIAKDVPPAELDAFLASDHATSTSLKNALEGMAELVKAAGSDNNWRTRQSLGQKAGPVIGMVEARALLLRARLLQQKPSTLAELRQWLNKHQAQIDMRALVQGPTTDRYTRFNQDRADAGIPEIVHTGLAVDAAKVLARGGQWKDAARLLWWNRDAQLGITSKCRMLSLAALFARKGGDTTMAIRCELESVGAAPDPRNTGSQEALLLLTELPATRHDLLEFGDESDLLRYVENMVIPYADSSAMNELVRIVPEVQDAPASLVMRNTTSTGTENIFSASLSSGNCNVVARNWAKMMASPETYPICHRFAAWTIVSDLTVSSSRTNHNGLATTEDALVGLAMLHSLNRRIGANDAKALGETDRLAKLLETLAANLDGSRGISEDWWD